MIERSNRHWTKLTMFTWANSLLHANFHCQLKGHGKVMYKEKWRSSIIYKIESLNWNWINLDLFFERQRFIYCAAGCDLNNGGCEQRCVRNPDRCMCNAGFTLSTNQRDCVGKHNIVITFCLECFCWGMLYRNSHFILTWTLIYMCWVDDIRSN